MEQIEMLLHECAEEIHKREKNILEDCFEIGKQLLKARDALRQWGGGGTWGDSQQGKWLQWLKTDVKMSRKQSQRFMDVYERYSQLVDIDHLRIDVSFYVLATLAAPHADPVAVAEVEKELKQGKKLSVVEVLKRVPSTKPFHKSKTKEPKKLKPIPVAVDEPFLIDLVNEIRRRRKEA